MNHIGTLLYGAGKIGWPPPIRYQVRYAESFQIAIPIRKLK